jgi:C1A family cysteine protease
MTDRSLIRYGWQRDFPDHRDILYTVSSPMVPLPPHVDLRPQCPPIYAQGWTNSCTGNATAGAIHFDKLRQGLPPVIPSRLFLYYNGRVPEGGALHDRGAAIRDVVKGAAKYGYPAETSWPFEIERITRRPDAPVYVEAAPHAIRKYLSVPQVGYSIRNALASGLPVICGVSVYQSFEREDVLRSGIVPLPRKTERLLGGHAILLVGYDAASKRYIWRNSWGETYGMQGYGTIPYAFVEDPQLAADFWVINSVV